MDTQENMYALSSGATTPQHEGMQKKSIKSTNKLFSCLKPQYSFPTKPTRCHCHVTYCTEKKRKALNDITKTRGKEQKITVV